MKLDRVTLYFRGEMMGNFHRVEARSAEITVRPYAQYAAAVDVRFVKKGARRTRGFVQTYEPSLVVLGGWGHPAPDGIFDESTTVHVSEDASITRGRHSGHSPAWATDFAAMIEKHVADTGAVILVDYRGHNPHDRMKEAAS